MQTSVAAIWQGVARPQGKVALATGPINRQDGTAWLAEGEVADDGTLAGMSFYVEGMTGEIPN